MINADFTTLEDHAITSFLTTKPLEWLPDYKRKKSYKGQIWKGRKFENRKLRKSRICKGQFQLGRKQKGWIGNLRLDLDFALPYLLQSRFLILDRVDHWFSLVLSSTFLSSIHYISGSQLPDYNHLVLSVLHLSGLRKRGLKSAECIHYSNKVRKYWKENFKLLADMDDLV